MQGVQRVEVDICRAWNGGVLLLMLTFGCTFRSLACLLACLQSESPDDSRARRDYPRSASAASSNSTSSSRVGPDTSMPSTSAAATAATTTAVSVSKLT